MKLLPVALAQEVTSASSPLSIAMCKFLMDEAWASTPERAMLDESRCLRWVMRERNHDVKEGFQAFLQKREPAWGTDSMRDLPPFLPFGPRQDVRPRSQRLSLQSPTQSKL